MWAVWVKYTKEDGGHLHHRLRWFLLLPSTIFYVYFFMMHERSRIGSFLRKTSFDHSLFCVLGLQYSILGFFVLILLVVARYTQGWSWIGCYHSVILTKKTSRQFPLQPDDLFFSRSCDSFWGCWSTRSREESTGHGNLWLMTVVQAISLKIYSNFGFQFQRNKTSLHIFWCNLGRNTGICWCFPVASEKVFQGTL